MNLFQKKLEDIIRGARLSDIDLITYNSQVLADIKEELKSRDPEVKAGAVIKLFYFYHDGSSLDWANFHILECMSSQSPNAKRVGYMIASISLTPQSDAMTMSTNLFKKGIKSNAVGDISLMLSCLGNICTIELGREVIEPVLNHCHNTKSVIRKKAFATLRTIYEENPNIIPHTIEKVLSRLNDEKEANVISTILSILFTALQYQPKLHPLFIKPLYSFFEKKRNNWTLIKVVKLVYDLFDILIGLEPRLKKKLYEAFLKLFSTTAAKSVEIELINTVFKYFKEYTDLYKKACHKLKSFIDSTDPNLKALGLQSLKRLLQNDREIFDEYYDFLLETFQKGDQHIKITIGDIFTEYLDKKNTEQAVNIMVKSLDSFNKNGFGIDAADTLIKNILTICSKNYYANVEDCEWLVMGVLFPVLSKTKKVDTANLALHILTDFTLRVDEIKELAVQYGLSLLNSLGKDGMNLYPIAQTSFICKNDGPQEDKANIPTKVLETLLFIFGEYSPRVQDSKELFSILKALLVIDPAIMKDINAPLEVCLVKMTISLCNMLIDEEDGPSRMEEFLNSAVKLLRTAMRPELDRMSFCKNEYMAVLFGSLGLDNSVIEKETFTVTRDAMEKCKQLKEIVFHPMKPVQTNAQELVKIPMELVALEVELTVEEKAMISAFEKEMSKPLVKFGSVPNTNLSAQMTPKKNGWGAEKKNVVAAEDKKEEAEDDESADKSKTNGPKVKREFRVLTDEERPQEVRTN